MGVIAPVAVPMSDSRPESGVIFLFAHGREAIRQNDAG